MSFYDKLLGVVRSALYWRTMIVQTDFLDHWKTHLFKSIINQPDSVELILRLWGECQLRKKWEFENFDSFKLSVICRWKGDPAVLIEAFSESAYAYFLHDKFIVHQWNEVNNYLVSAWKNGQNGGRPKNRPVTDRLTEAEPTGKPTILNYTRLNKTIKEDNINIIQEIYNSYPKKVSRAIALKAISKALEREKSEVLLEATKAYATAVFNWPENEKQFIPMPATWFNQERYLDDRSTWNRQSKPSHFAQNLNDFEISRIVL